MSFRRPPARYREFSAELATGRPSSVSTTARTPAKRPIPFTPALQERPTIDGTSPVIKGLGFPLGTRGQMFYLNPQRPNALEPHKRPRATLTPTLVTKDGNPYMVFGTPGGDAQEQWTSQFFLNYVDFGMDIQEALDAPTVHTNHFPSSFYPRPAYPAKVVAESRIPQPVIDELIKRGHRVEMTGEWSNGKVMGIRFDKERGVISGGVAAKGNIGYAIGW